MEVLRRNLQAKHTDDDWNTILLGDNQLINCFLIFTINSIKSLIF